MILFLLLLEPKKIKQKSLFEKIITKSIWFLKDVFKINFVFICMFFLNPQHTKNLVIENSYFYNIFTNKHEFTISLSFIMILMYILLNIKLQNGTLSLPVSVWRYNISPREWKYHSFTLIEYKKSCQETINIVTHTKIHKSKGNVSFIKIKS